MRKGILAKAMLLLFGVATIFSVFTPLEAGKVSAKTVDDFIDNIYLSHQDGTTTDPWSWYETVKVNMDWSLPNNTAKAGDTASFSLPAILNLTSDLSFLLLDPNGTAPNNVVGNVTVDKTTHIATITFTDYVETHSNVSGTMWFTSEFIRTAIENNTPITIEFVTHDGIVYDQDITFQGTGVDPNEVLFKEKGTIDPSDPSQIGWHIRVNAGKATIPMRY